MILPSIYEEPLTEEDPKVL
jgi:hypothetical protein